MATVTMVLSQLRWLRTCTYKDIQTPQYSHFSLVRTIWGKEKILYYRELLVSEKFFKTRWISLVLPSPVILGKKKLLLSRITG